MNKVAIKNNAISLGIFILISIALFYPQLQGKQYRSGDNLEYTAKSEELRQLNEELGRRVLWSDAIFSGMPAYFVHLPYTGNVLKAVNDIIVFTIGRPIGLFLLGLIIVFLCLKAIGVSHWMATIGALAAVITTNNFILYSAGHMSKIMTIFYIPFLLSGTILLFRKRIFYGFLLFSVGAVMTIMANHPQMIYYFALVLIPYFVYETFRYIKAKEWITPVKIYGLLVVGVTLGVLGNMSRIWTTIEYTNASTRGGSVLKEVASTNSEKGLGWDYAMQWSNGVVDIIPSLIPGAAGGASQEPVPEGSQLETLLKQNNSPKQNGKYLGPLYWGKLPFTSGPIYFGAALLWMVVFGFKYLDIQYKWLFGGAILLTILLSMGKYAGFINHFLFNYFPKFNNFRAPNSALSILPMFLAYAGVMGLDKYKEEFQSLKNKVVPKYFWISTIVLAGFCLIIAVLGTSLFSFEGANADTYAQQNVLNIIVEARQMLLKQDSMRSFLFVLLAALPFWIFFTKKINYNIATLILGVVLMLDAIPIGYRYFNTDNFRTERSIDGVFAPRPVDQDILSRENNRETYRVLDYSVNTMNTNMTSFHHNTIGGYHALKMSRYQDILNGYIAKNSPEVLNMLNTKYVIGQDGKLNVNSNANGVAWFVSNAEYVDSPDAEYLALETLQTKETAVVNELDFGAITGKQTSFSKGQVVPVQLVPDDLIYETENTDEGLLVLSELWYDGPGWKAYIDGEEVPLIRTNFALRGLVVPAGKHQVNLQFKPQSYLLGEKIALIVSLLLTLGLIYFIGKEYFGLFARNKSSSK